MGRKIPDEHETEIINVDTYTKLFGYDCDV